MSKTKMVCPAPDQGSVQAMYFTLQTPATCTTSYYTVTFAFFQAQLLMRIYDLNTRNNCLSRI